jgi:methionyl-tRNA formyltransferase
MRVVFMGTPEFAVPSLEALTAAHDVVAVYTAPDRPAGRGLRLRSSAVGSAAREMGLQLHQPSSLKDPVELTRLGELSPDVICVAAYGSILPPSVLAIPVHGCVNVHASLLPRWRGAAPIERSILAGDATTGVSIMAMEAGLDTGAYAAQSAVPVDDATAGELRVQLAETGARLLLGVLDEIARGSVSWTTQDESLATYAAKITAADVALAPEMSIEEASRRVRASGGTASSRAVIGGRVIIIERISPASDDLPRGGVIADRAGLRLGLADGSVAVDRLRPSGRSSMDGCEFARGARFGENAGWEAVL